MIRGIKITKNLGIAFVLLLGFACSQQKGLVDDLQSFTTTLDVHLEAIAKGNLEQLAPTVSESVIMIGPDGRKYDGKDAFMDLHKNWFASSNWKWDGRILKTESSDSLGFGLVQYKYTENDPAGHVTLESNAYLILVFKNSALGWQLTHDQNTSIPTIK